MKRLSIFLLLSPALTSAQFNVTSVRRCGLASKATRAQRGRGSRSANKHNKGVTRRSLLLLLTAAGCLGSGAAVADKFAGTCECGKSDPQHLLPAGDRPDHKLGVEASKCVWTKPLDIAGDVTKDGIATHVIEVKGKNIRFHGVHEVTLQSGDKIAMPYQGSGTSKDNNETQSKGTFSLSEGTGKLKGIKGNGTFSCKSAGEGVNCDVEGEYQLSK